MKTNLEKGFTLIELLVVIAIIGVLSSVVMASLNSARAKGSDAVVRANLTGIKSQAALSASNNSNSFANVCTDTNVLNAIDSAKAAAGVSAATNVTLTTAGGAATATCHAATNSWAVEAPFKTDPAQFFCVDYTGKSAETTGSTLGASDTDCQ